MIGIGDDIKGPRLRHDAVVNARRHQGQGMHSAMTYSQRRPASAPSQGSRRREANPIPGFQNLLVTTQLATVPRVKPEAEANKRRASGAGMAGVLTQDIPNRAFVSQSYQEVTTEPEYSIPEKNAITEYSPDKTVAVVVPRVKPEAGNNAELGVHGNVGKMMAESYEEARKRNIENGMREVPKPKNHIQANIQRMRLIQKKAKANERNKKIATPVKALWRSGKYAAVEPRVAIDNTWQRPPTQNGPRPSTAPAKSRDFIAKNARSAWNSGNKIRKTKNVAHVENINENKRRAQEMYDLQIRGTVPQYLHNRKRELQMSKEEEYARTHPDPMCPPGHALLPEAQRRETLEKLQAAIADYEAQLATLPVRQCDSLAYKHRKENLEREIYELDEAIKTFSKRKVYVQQ